MKDQATRSTSKSDGGGVPCWVIVTGIAIAAPTIVVVAMMLVGGGQHGPGRHMPGSGGQSDSSHVPSPRHTPTQGHAPVTRAPQLPNLAPPVGLSAALLSNGASAGTPR
jgi:hypothetical protein